MQTSPFDRTPEQGNSLAFNSLTHVSHNCESWCLIPFLQVLDYSVLFPSSSSRISIWKGFCGRESSVRGDGEGLNLHFRAMIMRKQQSTGKNGRAES